MKIFVGYYQEQFIQNKSFRTFKNTYYFYNDLTKEKDRDFENNILISVEPMAQNYQKIANESWTNTGNYLSKFIINDSQACKAFVLGLR